MALRFKASDFRSITNRRYVTDIKANFRAAPNTGSAVIKQFFWEYQRHPLGRREGPGNPGGLTAESLRPHGLARGTHEGRHELRARVLPLVGPHRRNACRISPN